MHISQEATNLAYSAGIRELAPLIQRVFDAEAQIVVLKKQVESLELAAKNSQPVHLRNVEKRTNKV